MMSAPFASLAVNANSARQVEFIARITHLSESKSRIGSPEYLGTRQYCHLDYKAPLLLAAKQLP